MQAFDLPAARIDDVDLTAVSLRAQVSGDLVSGSMAAANATASSAFAERIVPTAVRCRSRSAVSDRIDAWPVSGSRRVELCSSR